MCSWSLVWLESGWSIPKERNVQILQLFPPVFLFSAIALYVKRDIAVEIRCGTSGTSPNHQKPPKIVYHNFLNDI